MFTPRRRFIIKADDYGRGPLMDPWRRFIDCCLNHHAAPSIGVVGFDLSLNQPALALARFAAESYGVEFWNHSQRHVNLLSMSPEARLADTRLCHDILSEVIGRAPIAYGAPFNAVDAAAARDVVSVGPYRVLYDAVDGSSGAIEVPRNLYLSPELNTQTFRPIRFARFRTVFDRRGVGGMPPLLVLQVHPAYWTDTCFGEFERALGYLGEFGYTCVTAEEYADATVAARTETPTGPATSGALLTVYERLAAQDEMAAAVAAVPAPTVTARLLRRFGLVDPRHQIAPLRIGEFGSGSGLWSVAATTVRERITGQVFAADAAEAEALGTAFARAGLQAPCIFSPAAAEQLPLPERHLDFMVVQDGLEPDNIIPRLTEAARDLREQGRLLVVLPTEIRLVAAILDAALADNRVALLDSLDRWFRLAGRRAGVLPAAAAIPMWNDHEFGVLAMHAGFQPILRSIPLPGDQPWHWDLPLRQCHLLIRTDPSLRRAQGLRAGQAVPAEYLNALVAAGLGGTLAIWAAAWDSPPATGTNLAGMAVQATASGGEALAAWEALRGRLPAWQASEALAERLLRAEWTEAAALAAETPALLGPAGLVALAWLEARRNGGLPTPQDLPPGLAAALFNLGAAAADGEAPRLAETLLASPMAREWLLTELGGPSAASQYGYTEVTYQGPVRD